MWINTMRKFSIALAILTSETWDDKNIFVRRFTANIQNSSFIAIPQALICKRHQIFIVFSALLTNH